jgi:hypothetical protein
MKAFLALGRLETARISRMGSQIQRLVGAKNLTIDQRHVLSNVAQQMARLVSQSKSHRFDTDEAKIATLQKSIRELTRLVRNFNP